jgi:tRNA pseudouridine55 synthase
MEFKKEYDVEIKFGERTDTLDCTGNITKIKKYKYKSDSQIISALNSFLGEIKQIPPMFSALKHKGERLYNLARKGITIKREARKVFIDSIKLLKNNKNLIKIRVVCGKGTYVRSLARDIAYKLDTEGYVTELIRTKVGGFNENNSINVKDFKDWLLYQQHSQN